VAGSSNMQFWTTALGVRLRMLVNGLAMMEVCVFFYLFFVGRAVQSLGSAALSWSEAT